MVKKKEDKKNSETLGIAGFTLGITSLVLVLFSPMPGILASIVGFSFCKVQQKRKKTNLGKKGMIINAIGFFVNIAWWILLIKVVYPFLTKNLGELIV